MNNNKVKRIVIIAPLPNLKERVRLRKLTDILLESPNILIDFWGWDRSVNKGNEDFEAVNKRMLLTGGGEGKRSLVLFYIVWIIKVFFNVLFRGNKNDYFYCLGFDTAFPTAVINLFVTRNFIFDNPDNISKSYRWSRFLERVINKLENFCSKQASYHLVPGFSRINIMEVNTRIIPNTPTSSIHKKAIEIASEKGYQRGEIFTIYINGYLTKARGIEQIYQSVKKCNNKINIIVAGYPRCEAANKLLKLPNVQYYGNVSNEEALALYYNSHLAFTYYDPVTEVNQLAEPNKWGDCLATNTPFLANIEIITAEKFLKNKTCFGLPYHDTEGLTRLLDELSANLDKWHNIVANLKKCDFKYWDEGMRSLLNEFLEVK